MATISENLLTLNETKQAIKTAIENKGQNLTDVPFTKYAEKIDAIQGGSGDNPSKYLSSLYSAFKQAEFPSGYELVLEVNLKSSGEIYSAFMQCKNIKSIKLVNKGDKDIVTNGQNAFREISTLETIDLTEFNRKFTMVNWFVLSCPKLKSIYGALDLSKCTGATAWLNGANSLEDIEFVPETIKISIDFYWTQKLTKASITSAINGLSLETNGLTATFNEAGVKKAFETIEGANDGDTSVEWNNLVNTKQNWNITLTKW